MGRPGLGCGAGSGARGPVVSWATLPRDRPRAPTKEEGGRPAPGWEGKKNYSQKKERRAKGSKRPLKRARQSLLHRGLSCVSPGCIAGLPVSALTVGWRHSEGEGARAWSVRGSRRGALLRGGGLSGLHFPDRQGNRGPRGNRRAGRRLQVQAPSTTKACTPPLYPTPELPLAWTSLGRSTGHKQPKKEPPQIRPAE